MKKKHPKSEVIIMLLASGGLDAGQSAAYVAPSPIPMPNEAPQPYTYSGIVESSTSATPSVAITSYSNWLFVVLGLILIAVLVFLFGRKKA